jgi:hypothetical protein
VSRIILFLVLLGGIVFWWHWTNTPDATQRKRLLQRSVIGALIVVILLLVVTGHMHWLGAVVAGLLAFVRQNMGLLVRVSPLIAQILRTRTPGSGTPGISTVSTRLLQMSLNHATGKLSGSVLTGEFMGRLLDELSKPELDRLLEWCVHNDTDSARLLDSYLVNRFGGPSTHSGTAGRNSGDMNVEEALQVLGLAGTPTKNEITRAYRKVMQQLHPDRGGSEYFAAKVNQAREVLNSRFG